MSVNKNQKKKEYYNQNRDKIWKKQSTYYFEKNNEFREKCFESYFQNPLDPNDTMKAYFCYFHTLL